MLPGGEGGAQAGLRLIAPPFKVWGSRFAVALFVILLNVGPALAEVCDKGDDIEFGYWMPIGLFVFVAGLAACWVYRIWQAFLVLAALLFAFSCLLIVSWFDMWSRNDFVWRAMLSEGCATEFSQIYIAAAIIIGSFLLGLVAWWLRRKFKNELDWC